MLESKLLKNYLNEKYSKENNYYEILQKVKGSGTMKKRKILNIAAILLIVIMLGALTPSIYAKIQWNIEYQEYENRPINYGSATINEAIQEYEKNIQMDYIYKNDIGIKIDSLILTNDYFKINVNFRLPENIELNTQTFRYGFAIYDENNNIYGIQERMLFKDKKDVPYWEKLYKELGINYNKKDVFAVELNDSSGMGVITCQKGNIITYTQMTSNKGFPKSKKLYIRIFDIGYDLTELNEDKTQILSAQNVNITNDEWIIELNIPEEFYTRQSINLKLANEVEGLKVSKAELTQTALVLKVEQEGLRKAVMDGRNLSEEEFTNKINEAIHIEDEQGNTYNYTNLSTTENPEEIQLKFSLSQKDISKKLYLCVKINGKDYKVELIT